MYDIFYYYQGSKPVIKIDEIKQSIPTAKFIETTGDISDLILTVTKLATTKLFWLIPVGIIPTHKILEFKVLTEDVGAIHVPINNAAVFLVPKKQTSIIKQMDFDFFKSQYDVIFLSNGEENADNNWKNLVSKVPYAKRVDRVSGIFNAHTRASKISDTEFFYVVDADAKLRLDFNFDYLVPKWDFDTVHIWSSHNPVINVNYGYGGIKLFPKFLFSKAVPNVDVTTGLTTNIKVIDTVSNDTEFATSDFAAWRSAFRECSKLSSNIIPKNVLAETESRLLAWCTLNENHKYGIEVYHGALSGANFGKQNIDKPDSLKLINDYDWLSKQFNRYLETRLPLEKFQ